MPVVLENIQKHWFAVVDEDGYDIPLTDINQLNVFGESPIHIAAWKGSADDVLWLLKNGADINQRGEFSMTPLHYAYMGGKQENIEVLINAGADQNLRCDRGLLPGDARQKAS
jgi:ankyrin repeat protein